MTVDREGGILENLGPIWAIGPIFTLGLAISAHYLLPEGLIGVSVLCIFLVVVLIMGFWFSVDKALKDVKKMIKKFHQRVLKQNQVILLLEKYFLNVNG